MDSSFNHPGSGAAAPSPNNFHIPIPIPIPAAAPPLLCNGRFLRRSSSPPILLLLLLGGRWQGRGRQRGWGWKRWVHRRFRR